MNVQRSTKNRRHRFTVGMLRLGRKLYEYYIVRKIVFISKKTGLGVRTLIKYSPTDSLKLASGSENRVGHVSIVFYGVCDVRSVKIVHLFGLSSK